MINSTILIFSAFNTVLPPQVRGGGGLGGSSSEGGSFGACPSPPTGSSGSRTPTRYALLVV